MLWYDHLCSVTDFGQNVHGAYQQMSNLRPSKAAAAARQCFVLELVSRRYSHARTMQRIPMYCQQSRPRDGHQCFTVQRSKYFFPWRKENQFP
jgi:hypothetical protein